MDASRAIATNRLPAGSLDRRNGDLDPVEIGTSDHRGDLSFGDLKVDHRTVADIGASARQAVLVVAVAFEVRAPRLAPETFGNRTPLDLHGSNGPSPLLQLGHFAFRLSALLGHRYIWPPGEVVAHPSASFIAACRSSATRLSNSSSFISVNVMSAPPLRKSPASCCFESIIWSILSSTVPRQMNLWISTFLVCPMRKARSVAWFSTAGFHHRSKWITCEAAVRLSPAPPALSESTKNGTLSSSWNRRTSSLRLLTSVSPCRTRPARPNTEPRNAASGAVVSRN